MENIILVVAYLAMLAACTERVVQIVKNIKYVHFNENGILISTVVVGILFAICGHPKQIDSIIGNEYVAAIILGILASSGSKLWHDLLGVVQQYKDSITVNNTGK